MPRRSGGFLEAEATPSTGESARAWGWGGCMALSRTQRLGRRPIRGRSPDAELAAFPFSAGTLGPESGDSQVPTGARSLHRRDPGSELSVTTRSPRWPGCASLLPRAPVQFGGARGSARPALVPSPSTTLLPTAGIGPDSPVVAFQGVPPVLGGDSRSPSSKRIEEAPLPVRACSAVPKFPTSLLATGRSWHRWRSGGWSCPPSPRGPSSSVAFPPVRA